MKKPTFVTKLTLLTGALWALPWAWLMIRDVRARTAIGQGTAGHLDMHEVFELLFAAAHFGIRLVGGWSVLLGIWLAVHAVLQRAEGSLGRLRRAVATE